MFSAIQTPVRLDGDPPAVGHPCLGRACSGRLRRLMSSGRPLKAKRAAS
jgi:hypothetical protein